MSALKNLDGLWELPSEFQFDACHRMLLMHGHDVIAWAKVLMSKGSAAVEFGMVDGPLRYSILALLLVRLERFSRVMHLRQLSTACTELATFQFLVDFGWKFCGCTGKRNILKLEVE